MFFWSYVCFCNFRLLLLYGRCVKSASIIIKITTFARQTAPVYSVNMSIFVKSTPANRPKTKNAPTIALLYAGILVVFVVAQLFSFEEFITIIDSYWLPGGIVTARVLSAVIVITEVFALPFLLRMRLSPAMRVVSMVCGWMVAAVWIKLTLWLMLTTNAVTTVGLLGDVVSLTPGWWSVMLSLSLGILAAWSSWGMWPLVRKK